MQKGYKREAKAMAVLRCFIGIFFVIFIVLLAFFLLKMDYTDKLTEESKQNMRDYVETTAVPTVLVEAEPTLQPAANMSEPGGSGSGGLTVLTNAGDTPTATPEPTEAPTEAPTATPSPEPTPEVTPTVAPTETPLPTSIPAAAISAIQFDKPALPEVTSMDAKAGITYSYRSAVDANRYLELRGYAYLNDASFDGSDCEVYLVLMQDNAVHYAVVKTELEKGISGLAHEDAVCKNADFSDWKAVIDVSEFPDSIYTMGAVIAYKVDGKVEYAYFLFPDYATFTVLGENGVLTDVHTVSEE